MSTTPGDSTWADAGLVPPENSAVPGSERSTVPVDPASQPRAARPDLRDEGEVDAPDEEERSVGTGAPRVPEDAPEGDALEQAQEVDEVGYASGTSAQRDDAAEGDVLEQSIPVPDDGSDDYRG
jgi:hypothetical protein